MTPASALLRRAGSSPAAAALAIVILCSTVSGCALWPGYGGGGWAERHPVDCPEVLPLMERLDALDRRGASAFHKGRMVDADLMIVRARRELAGGLKKDAQFSMYQADLILTAIENDMARSSARSGKKPKRGE